MAPLKKKRLVSNAQVIVESGRAYIVWLFLRRTGLAFFAEEKIDQAKGQYIGTNNMIAVSALNKRMKTLYKRDIYGNVDHFFNDQKSFL